MAQKAESEVFGKMSSGEDVMLHTLENSNGMRVRVMDYGATLVSVEVPDRDGKLANVTLSLDSLEDYLAGHPLFGSTVGRFANRIAGGGFSIDGKSYDLETVNKKTGVHIHGGKTGFAKQLWKGSAAGDEIVLRLISEDGHEGYPGRLDVTATYYLSHENELTITYEATTNKPTHVNLTNHVYWNLNGAGTGDILDHSLSIKSEKRLEVDQYQVPTGEMVSVEGTAFDFRRSKKIGADISETPNGKGYDHFFLAEEVEHGGDTSKLLATAYSEKSGREMRILTNQAGGQFYTANHLKPPYGKHHGFCIETQAPPNAPNEPNFASTLLRPGDRYRAVTLFIFPSPE